MSETKTTTNYTVIREHTPPPLPTISYPYYRDIYILSCKTICVIFSFLRNQQKCKKPYHAMMKKMEKDPESRLENV